ncbi:MAG: DUF3080 family protein [Halomonas sp.]|nr:DUF3080 family protein [Halomonas sp.]MCC5900302.1 DUF3080 family protein [Halomonas sp.]
MPPTTLKNFLCTLPVLLALAGCSSNDAEQPWITYHEQLAADLGIASIDRSTPRNISAFPERQNRQIPIPEIRASMMNVYALRECQITSLVAARNNQLGRVAPPSQQWLYERTLWQRLSSCWESETANNLSNENRARLEQLTLQKTAQLPAVGWNAIFESSEWEKSFSRASQPIAPSEAADITQQLAAIHYLGQMVMNQFNPEWKQDSSTLEQHLKTLQERPLTAELLRSLLLAEQRLSEANLALSAQEFPAETCLQPWDTAWLTTVEQQAEQWLLAINRLIDAHDVIPPEAVSEYQSTWLSMSNPEAPWLQFQAAKTAHKQLRSHFLKCSNA